MRSPASCLAPTTCGRNTIGGSLLQRWNAIERIARLDLKPVRVERRPIELRPLPDQGQRVLRGDVADDLVPVEVELPMAAIGAPRENAAARAPCSTSG